jgi:hypothetical protein
MKETFTIIEEEFNTATGVTTVSINTDYGVFTGQTKLDDMDAEYPSVFQGYEIALAKAQRKWAKAMVIIIREKIQPLKAVISQTNWYWTNTEKPVFGQTSLLVNREIEKWEKELTKWQNRIKAMDKAINDRIAARDKLVKAYLDKKK